MKTRRTLLAGLVILALCVSPSAFALAASTSIVPSGKVVSRSPVASGYTGIAVSVPGTVVVRQGPAESVAIEADDNLMSEIEAVVERGSLRIRFRRPLSIAGKPTIRVLVTGTTFDSLSVSGSGDIIAESLKARTLDVAISGSGDVKIAKLEAESLRVSIAGSGDFRAGGHATELAANIAGSGDIDAGRIDSRRVRVSIAGSGNATFLARESLDATVLGSGDVRYHGDPAITKRIAGSGSLKRLGPAP